MSAIFQKISMYLGATILVVIAGIILIFTLTAIMMKVEDLIFGKSPTPIENPNNEGANENKEMIQYDENTK